MSSPYAEFENATIAFEIAKRTAGTNAAGNRKITQEIQPVRACLKVGKPKNDRPASVPESAEFWEGHAIDPMILPPELKPLASGKAELSGYSGKFTLDSGTLNAPHGRAGIGALMEEAQGTFFSGWFERFV